jgi:hypothetical protein
LYLIRCNINRTASRHSKADLSSNPYLHVIFEKNTSGRVDIATSKRFVWESKNSILSTTQQRHAYLCDLLPKIEGAIPSAIQHLPSFSKIRTISYAGKEGTRGKKVQARWTENAVEIEGLFLSFIPHTFQF